MNNTKETADTKPLTDYGGRSYEARQTANRNRIGAPVV
jgi:hypothetical protein